MNWNIKPPHFVNEHHCQGSPWQTCWLNYMQSMQVAVSAFYQTPDAATHFATTFFNQTIDIVETKKMVDFELISLYATILALLAGIGAPIREWRVRVTSCHMLSSSSSS